MRHSLTAEFKLRMSRAAFVATLLVTACRGSAPSAHAQSVDQKTLQSLIDSLMPGVSKAAGLQFKSVPRSAVRTRDQIAQYLVAKLARELPPERLDGIAAAYRLLQMVPDSVDLRKLFLDLYTEQIVGFYDPDSTALFAVAGSDPATLRLVLAHELVHALQHQYVPLDSILHDATDADRQGAAQAIMEGQATLASLVVIMPGMDVVTNDAFWDTFKDQLHAQQTGTTVYARAPMVIREGLTFPYVAGAAFMRWFDKAHPGQVPYNTSMPSSTEQILHPDRYASGDQPLKVRFTGDSTGVIFDDTFGEYDIELLRAQLQGQQSVRTDPAIGWGGDRLRVYKTPDGPALVWYTLWDEPRYAEQFRTQIGQLLLKTSRPGYRVTETPLQVSATSAVRIVVAPTGWTGWKTPPTAVVVH